MNRLNKRMIEGALSKARCIGILLGGADTGCLAVRQGILDRGIGFARNHLNKKIAVTGLFKNGAVNGSESIFRARSWRN